MGGARAQHAEVARRIDQPTAEVIQPDAIRKDAAHKGMVPLHQMSSVSEPTARGGQRGVLLGNPRPAGEPFSVQYFDVRQVLHC